MISSFERIKSQVNSAVMMARRIHLFPFRTQKLSFVTPRVVRGTPLARVGSRRAIWRISSAGRASALQAGGHRFEPYPPYESLAQSVEHLTFNQRVDSSSLSRLIYCLFAGVAELADALDLGSSVFMTWGFKSLHPHHL